MSKESVVAFEADLRHLLNRYRAEFDLTVCEAVGILELEKMAVAKTAFENEEEE